MRADPNDNGHGHLDAAALLSPRTSLQEIIFHSPVFDVRFDGTTTIITSLVSSFGVYYTGMVHTPVVHVHEV
jgi:hypothetical protein